MNVRFNGFCVDVSPASRVVDPRSIFDVLSFAHVGVDTHDSTTPVEPERRSLSIGTRTTDEKGFVSGRIGSNGEGRSTDLHLWLLLHGSRLERTHHSACRTSAILRSSLRRERDVKIT